jgi:penicillin-binding protein 1C
MRARAALCATLALTASICAAWYSLERAALPSQLLEPAWSRALFAADGRLLDMRIAADEQWRLPLATQELPAKYVVALLDFEDRHFLCHPGINPFSIARAGWSNWRAGRVVSGASTITMQLARIALDNPPRTYANKLRELWLTLQMEWRFSKPQLLALYATHAPFGGNIVGVHAASWRYFGRGLARLSWAEATLLAVLPNSPSLLHPGRNRDLLLRKRNRLLQRLHQQDDLSEADYRLALLEPLPLEPAPWPVTSPQLLQRLISAHPGQQLFHTTLDLNLQRDVQRLVAQHAPQLAREGVRNSAVVVIDHQEMRTLVYVGNHTDSASSGRDMDIANRVRSTGSLLKPFLYGLMLQEGELLPGTLVPDLPTNIGGYAPENFDRSYRGAVPAREVLAQSLNVPSVRMLQRYGVARFRDRLQAFGLTSIDRSAEDYGLSLILGGAEASLWDLASLYANLSHVAANPDAPALRRTVRLLRDSDNDNDTSADEFPLRSGAAWLTLQAMTQVVRPGNDMFWRDYQGSQVIAWKTGTSFGLRDGWAIGSNGRHTAAVWTGNADGSAAATLGGGHSAGPLLMQVFSALGNAAWIAPPGQALQTVRVCSEDGYLAAHGCETSTVLAPRDTHFAIPLAVPQARVPDPGWQAPRAQWLRAGNADAIARLVRAPSGHGVFLEAQPQRLPQPATMASRLHCVAGAVHRRQSDRTAVSRPRQRHPHSAATQRQARSRGVPRGPSRSRGDPALAPRRSLPGTDPAVP